MHIRQRHIGVLLLLCIVAEVLAIVGSWLCGAIMPDAAVQSLLTPEGVRWFIGSYAEVLATDLLVWLLLIGMTLGIWQKSGIGKALNGISKALFCKESTPSNEHRLPYRERLGVQCAAIVALVAFVVVVLLSFTPHAILLSATGDLFPSSFSSGLVPIICCIAALSALAYGLVASTFTSLDSIACALTRGITLIASWLVIYIFVAHLYFTLTYIFF